MTTLATTASTVEDTASASAAAITGTLAASHPRRRAWALGACLGYTISKHCWLTTSSI